MRPQPPRKLDRLIGYMQAGNWRAALRLAARFADLGEHRAAIVRGHEAFTNRRFWTGLGRDPDALIQAGIAALQARYGHHMKEGTMPAKTTRTAGKAPAKRPRKATQADTAPAKPKARTARKARKAATAPDKPAQAANGRYAGRYAAQAEAAARGVLPNPPDFSAPSHARYRPKLAELVKLVEAGDVRRLRSFHIPTYSSSPKAMDRYRNLAVIALEARRR